MLFVARKIVFVHQNFAGGLAIAAPLGRNGIGFVVQRRARCDARRASLQCNGAAIARQNRRKSCTLLRKSL